MPTDLVDVETRNLPDARLHDIRSADVVVDKYRRMIFSQGFFRTRKLRIRARPLPGDLHIPYWVGFRGNGNKAHISVIDAVRRRMEGAKVRQLLESWLLDPSSAA
jgi:hypothetical protein